MFTEIIPLSTINTGELLSYNERPPLPLSKLIETSVIFGRFVYPDSNSYDSPWDNNTLAKSKPVVAKFSIFLSEAFKINSIVNPLIT